MKTALNLICAVCLLTSAVLAQSPVTLTIDTKSGGYPVAPNFAGVSIFTGTQVRDHRGVPGNLFSGTNTQLITLFKNTGIRHLRLGATGSPTSGSLNLSHEDIDSLFAFAKKADMKVIYSLHFADGVATAKYVWETYALYVDCFAFDNEPDSRLNDDSAAAAAGRTSYFESWKDFAKSVTAAVPGAKFAGPDAAGRNLVRRFVKAEKDTGALVLVTQHCYVDGNPLKKGIDTRHAIENMLSEAWVTNKYPELYHRVLESVAKQGLPFRLTELDDYVHGVTNASDAFISALWALDAMHWWAAHGAQGVNFQNTEWLRTDTFYPDADGNYQVHPKAYGIKAFNVGSQGSVRSVAIENTNLLNLTAYAVESPTNLCVTIINKEHGAGARTANVSLIANGCNSTNTSAMFLVAPNGDVGATNGVTLGGATIANNAPWQGQWTALHHDAKDGCSINVPTATAVVVKISTWP